MKFTRKSVSTVVDGCTNSNDIAGLFADKYKDLYSCVGFEENDMMLLRNKIDR